MHLCSMPLQISHDASLHRVTVGFTTQFLLKVIFEGVDFFCRHNTNLWNAISVQF